eukprot:PLAT13492.1.p1 GENE.PLAT13492.1~~PLAT13492.1.p1  ORF type:complete len:287 (+),score=136.28 PLAT13492.1:579-1439(+)
MSEIVAARQWKEDVFAASASTFRRPSSFKLYVGGVADSSGSGGDGVAEADVVEEAGGLEVEVLHLAARRWYKLSVKKSAILDELRAAITKLSGIAVDEQVLMFGGERVTAGRVFEIGIARPLKLAMATEAPFLRPTWDPTVETPGYGMLYDVSDGGRTVRKEDRNGIIHIVRAEEVVSSDSKWRIQIDEIGPGGASNDHQIGIINESAIEQIMPCCWMLYNQNAWCVDFRTFEAGDFITVEVLLSEAKVCFYRNDELHKELPMATSPEAVVPCIAMRTVGSQISSR